MSILDTHIERRKVLKGFLIAGPTLAIAARVVLDGSSPKTAAAFPTRTDEVPDYQDFTDIFVLTQQPTIYDLRIEIKPDNRVYAEGPKAEVGQGFLTTFALMVADNLDVPFDSMDVICSPAQQKWGSAQITGGSHNTRVMYDPVRVVCAKMRGQLMMAASNRLGVPLSRLRTQDGYVIATDGRKLAYGELTAEAAKLTEAMAAPKSAQDWKLIGKAQKKYGIERIVQGTYPYPMDLHSSKEYLPTVLALGATHGASVVSIDDSAAMAMKGVIGVSQIPGMPD